MKKIIFALLAAVLVCQPADAQFFKKIFKKKAKTEKKAKKSADGIDDAAQIAMADIATLADNTNNRNAFMGIPLGIKASLFEKQLIEKGFTERVLDGKHTAKSYIYDGQVYGAKCTVTLAVSDETDRVYAVDVTEDTIYPSLKEVKARFAKVKAELVKVYGRGFVDNQGEAYTIQTQLGTVNLHYERGSLTSSYTFGFALDDAKAYQMAYNEMDDKEYETAPRTIGKATAKVLPATFKMDSYQATASLARRKQAITAITLTATDDAEALCKDLTTYGFTSTDQKTWRQGRMTAIVKTNTQGQVVLTIK